MSNTGSAYYGETKKPVSPALTLAAATRTNLAETGRENNNLVDLPHLLQEVVDARALDDIDVMPVILDLHRHHVVRLLYRLFDI